MESPDTGESTPAHCPTCESVARVVCAASLAGNTAQPSGVHFLDIRLPRRVNWSGLWLCAAGCLVLGLAALLLAPSTGWYQAAEVFAVFAVTFEQDTVQLRPEAGFHSDLENPAGQPQDATDRDGET